MILRDLVLRIRALVAPRRVERELDEELAFHIQRETHKHIAAGLSPADARARALARFGPVPLAADRCRDARGIGVVDDLRRDVVYAFRTFRRAPLAALTIVATVVLGLGLVTAVFAVYSIFTLRVDAVRNPGELFAVTMERSIQPHPDSGGPFTRPDYDAMRRETSVFTDAFAMVEFVAARVEDRLVRGTVVTGNFFQVLGVQATLGRPLLPEDDERGAGWPVIVLSDTGWRKLFRGDRAVIGRRVVIEGAPYEIVGVMPDGFRGLGITPPDFWAPLTLAWHFLDDDAGRADEIGVGIVGRLKPGLSPEAVRTALGVWASGRTEFNRLPGRLRQVWLTPRQGTLSVDDSEMLLLFSPLFFAFGLTIVLGGLALVLTVSGLFSVLSYLVEQQAKEIGVRIALGAATSNVVRLVLSQSLRPVAIGLAAGGGLAAAVAIVLMATPAASEIGDVVDVFDPVAYGASALVIVTACPIAVSVPTLRAARIDPIATLRKD